MSENTVTINPEKLGGKIRSYLMSLVYEDEIPEDVEMAIILLVEAAQQSVHTDAAMPPSAEPDSSSNIVPAVESDSQPRR